MSAQALKSETKFNLYETITNQFIEAIEKGVSPFQMAWSTENGMPRNIKGNVYRGINFFSALLSCLENDWRFPVFMTFKQSKEQGLKVKKGSKSLIIKYSSIKVPKEYKDSPELCPSEKKIVFNKYYRVFNVAQIEGVDLDQFKVKEKPSFTPIQEAEKVWNEYKNRPSYQEEGAKAFYSLSSDSITMPPRNVFNSEEDFYSVFFHEMTHSTGSKTRLDRNLDGRRSGEKREQYAFEELVAELGAAFLSSHCGFLDVTFSQSASYLDSWLEAFKGDPKFLIDAASKAQKAVDHILSIKF